MSLASPVLRQVLSAVRRASKTYSDAQIHFQFVPEDMTHSCSSNSPSRHSEIDLLCFSVYDRLLRTVDRQMSRRLFICGERTRKYFQDPAFALARPLQTSVSFLRQTSPQSLDVVDRHTLLHVGYEITPCKKWILACCVDQRGEAHQIGVWLYGENENYNDAVRKIWEFTVEFARRANVEWRIVIAKLGAMSVDELDGMFPFKYSVIARLTAFPTSMEGLLSKSCARMSRTFHDARLHSLCRA
jgi:mediator of RNA polymerase II transcription subunit 13